MRKRETPTGESKTAWAKALESVWDLAFNEELNYLILHGMCESIILYSMGVGVRQAQQDERKPHEPSIR